MKQTVLLALVCTAVARSESHLIRSSTAEGRTDLKRETSAAHHAGNAGHGQPSLFWSGHGSHQPPAHSDLRGLHGGQYVGQYGSHWQMAQGGAENQHKGGGYRGGFGRGSHVKLITLTRGIPIPVPHPYPVEVIQPVPYKVDEPVPYEVGKPYFVHVEKPYHVIVEKPYPVTFETKVPYPVYVPQNVPVPHPYKVYVHKPVPYPVHFPVKVPVPHPVIIYKKVKVFVPDKEESGRGEEGGEEEAGGGHGNAGGGEEQGNEDWEGEEESIANSNEEARHTNEHR